MRPQLGPIPGEAAANLDDLGWNDMGHDHDQANESAVVVQLTPLVASEPSELVIHRHTASFGSKPAPRAQTAPDQGKRAAFTLRLEAQRPLHLRLPSPLRNPTPPQTVHTPLPPPLAETDQPH